MKRRRLAADVERGDDHGDKHQDEDGGPHKAELLADDGEDVVVVGLGQVVVLHRRVADASAEQAARGESHDCQRRLVAGVVRVAPRVQEGEEALGAIRRGDDGGGAEHECGDGDECDHAPGKPTQNRDGEHRQSDDDRGTQIGLLEDQEQREREHDEHLDEERTGVDGAVLEVIGKDLGSQDDDHRFGDLGGLQVEESEVDPARSAPLLGALADEKHRDEQHEHSEPHTPDELRSKERPRQQPTADHGKQHEADEHEDRLAVQEEPRAAVLLQGLDGRCRVDHEQAEHANGDEAGQEDQAGAHDAGGNTRDVLLAPVGMARRRGTAAGLGASCRTRAGRRGLGLDCVFLCFREPHDS